MSTYKSYASFKEAVFDHLSVYKLEYLNIIENGRHNNNEYKHILPRELRCDNLLEKFNNLEYIKYHMYSHHLDSSQMMCINFFAPLQHDNRLMIKSLKNAFDIPIDNGVTVCSCFEYTPDGPQKTNFDFFINLSNGVRIFFEVKYTENGFGNTKKDVDYSKVWDKFYSKQVTRSLYLKNITKDDFFRNYQINRNIAYIEKETDYICFIYPTDNMVLENNAYFKILNSRNLKNVIKKDWHDLTQIVLDISKHTSLFDYYTKFQDKYLAYNK